jgi:hypothetical protein
MKIAEFVRALKYVFIYAFKIYKMFCHLGGRLCSA